MKRIRLLAASALIALSIAGCGGGSGGTAPGGSNNDGTPGNDTVISGIASKGPITGTISIYALTGGGSKGSLLKSAPITAGEYSANIGKYAGPVLIEVSGSYTDEATGSILQIPESAPLRAALPDASDEIATAVTPLTELAVQKSGNLTPAAIAAGNKLVSDIFKVDIINTLPVAPTAGAVGAADQSQKDYTLAIAAVSQLSKTQDLPLSGTIATLAAGISSSGMSSQARTNFQDAVTTFITVNPNNTTGVKEVSATGLAAVGAVTASFTLTVQGTVAARPVNGIQFDIVIPDGLTVNTDATGKTLPGVVSLSTSASAAAPYLETYYSAASGVLKIAIITDADTGIVPGALATIACETVPGWTVPQASAFSIRNVQAADAGAATISGIGVTIN